jgi:hypothetical protein
VLGNQPAAPEHLVDNGTQPSDADARQEITTRYGQLRAAGNLLLTEMQAAVAGGTEDDQQALLRLAARWGITPAVQAEDTLADRLSRALDSLQERLTSAPAVADVATRTLQQIATEIAELAAPEGQLAVLSRIDLTGWPTTFAAASALDADWLTINAAVRNPLARLEAHQLDAALDGLWSPFTAWTNRPADPWQRNVPPTPNGAIPASRLVAIYGLAAVLDQTTVAFGLLDSWGETVPDVQQDTTAAFGFNAPAARAPQAILIAVSPVPDEPLTSESLVEILAETRELAHARMATPADLHALDAALPLMMLPASGATNVELEPQH